ncbi:FecCD family ABC transporter permease [Nocardia sp. NPDC050406]|uniref:FecCD family ABC transporter permease n=1 Tax=Nocardia sp. NPDC050406 TaxID=3364318 RepID=UPI003788F5E9
MASSTLTRPGATVRRAPRRRRVIGLSLLVCALLVGVAASLAVGAHSIALGTVWTALFDRFTTDAADIAAMTPDRAARNDAAITIRTLRLPRTLLAIAAGAALGTAGALIQGHTRNPIADPGLLGVNAGAAFAVVVAVAALGLRSPSAYVWFALAGAGLAAVLVFGLAQAADGGPLTLVLVGSGLTLFLSALTSATVLSDTNALNVFRFWNTGSIAARGFDVLWVTLPLILLGLILAFAQAGVINMLNLGEDVARGVGVDIVRSRLLGLLALTLLAGAATAACGAIAFVGLMVPHLVRRLTGPDHRWLLPYAALAGAVLVLLADIAGRMVMRPGEIPVGTMLALLGAPCFVALVWSGRVRRG